MSTGRKDEQVQVRSLRLWPGVAAVALQWTLRFVVPLLAPSALALGAMGGLAGGLIVILWWLFWSRAPWRERLGAVGLMALGLIAGRALLDESLATGGMGMLYFMYAVPLLSLAFVAWAVLSRGLSAPARWATMAAAIFVACGVWALLRTGGITGGLDSDFAWRWAPTAEERLLAAAEGEGRPSQGRRDGSLVAFSEGADWPGFRGPGRDSHVPAQRIATDWSERPPTELWRRPVGPGWSSFAIVGDLLYTQEQRGEEEVVSCYDLATGEPVWRHGDAARFWESNAGAGPRGTPTLSGGRVYTLGATGIVNALDAADGTVIWSRDAASDLGIEVPDWGFSGSPLLIGERVIVGVSGQLAAYDRETGELRWSGLGEGVGYSSPHRATIDGVEQVLYVAGASVLSVAAEDGTLLWEHEWDGYPIVQPAVTAGGDVLASVDQGSGTRRLAVENGAGGWTVTERWTSIRLKPYFNDFVVHEGHAYGFDGAILAAMELEEGERAWKGGRYGHGQLVLLPDQDLLLVLSERGELVLVRATPDGHDELARFQALEGKTWNHPVLVDDLLLVRNGEEMAAFRLPLAAG